LEIGFMTNQQEPTAMNGQFDTYRLAVIAGNRLIARTALEPSLIDGNGSAADWACHAWLSDSPAAALLSLQRAIELDPNSSVAQAGQQFFRLLEASLTNTVFNDVAVADVAVADVAVAVVAVAVVAVAEADPTGSVAEVAGEPIHSEPLSLDACSIDASSIDACSIDASSFDACGIDACSTETSSDEPCNAEPCSDEQCIEHGSAETCSLERSTEESSTCQSDVVDELIATSPVAQQVSDHPWHSIEPIVDQALANDVVVAQLPTFEDILPEQPVAFAHDAVQACEPSLADASCEPVAYDPSTETTWDVANIIVPPAGVREPQWSEPTSLEDVKTSPAAAFDAPESAALQSALELAQEARDAIETTQSYEPNAWRSDEESGNGSPSMTEFLFGASTAAEPDVPAPQFTMFESLEGETSQPQVYGEESAASSMEASVEDAVQELSELPAIEPVFEADVETGSDADVVIAATTTEPIADVEAPRTESLAPAVEAVVAEDNRPLVLAVDDSPTVRKLVAMTLERAGFKVVTAEDGVAALNMLGDIQPSLVLSDIAMPRLGGYQLCKLLKKHPRTRDIPVIMLSGKDGVFDKLRGTMVGAADFVTKPFDPTDLIAKVESYVGTPAR
jgi:twitching motility two-component system response regulator PilG